METDSDIEGTKAEARDKDAGTTALAGTTGLVGAAPDSGPEPPVAYSRPFRRVLHAASGAAILAIDWLLFSGNIVSGGMATLPAMALGFVLGGLSTGLIQRFAAGDSTLKSLGKGLVAGLVVGAPTPVAGTVLGGVVLAVSGLSTSRVRSIFGLR